MSAGLVATEYATRAAAEVITELSREKLNPPLRKTFVIPNTFARPHMSFTVCLEALFRC